MHKGDKQEGERKARRRKWRIRRGTHLEKMSMEKERQRKKKKKKETSKMSLLTLSDISLRILCGHVQRKKGKKGKSLSVSQKKK